MLRKVLFALYLLVVACMGTATFIEKYRGTDFVHTSVYGSWWFVVLWVLLIVTGVVYIVRRRMRRPSAVMLHASFVLILVGAFTTHVSGVRGTVHLRSGETVRTYVVSSHGGSETEKRLPFALRLDSFAIEYHTGTTAAADYVSRFTVIDDDGERCGEVSMNKVFSYRSVRLCQSSYDSDMSGSVLTVNYDPYGIPLTYAGYALLFFSLVMMLVSRNGAYRRLLRSPLLRKGVLSLLLVAGPLASYADVGVLPKETADRFGRLYILYGDRVCPLQTFAADFTRKLYGSSTYKGYTAEQVLTGFIFWGDEWCDEPLFRLKNGALRSRLQLPRYCSVNTFFNRVMGGYILGPYVQEYYQGSADGFHKEVADVDDRLMMVMNLRRGSLLKVFPFTSAGSTVWYAPTDGMADSLIGDARRKYMQNVFSLVYAEVKAGRYNTVDSIFDKMLKYQLANAGSSLPSDFQVKAERTYNAVPFTTVLFMLDLAAGLILLIVMAFRLVRRGVAGATASCGVQSGRVVNAAAVSLSVLSLVWLTVCLALRWIISGRVPMANGYETMLVMAWFVLIVGLMACRRFRIALPFALLMSGCFLLVSHIGQMNPQITPVMPVLSSPLLSVHVSVIMMSFAMLSLTFICAVVAIVLHLVGGTNCRVADVRIESLALLSRILLYPALALLCVGIFVGAVWANVSWGTYWSWDAKEVWGLITLMVYAVAVHDGSISFLRRPLGYHLFMAVAFFTIIMTYFGVNYFLGGMHSYA